jgi:endonuclease/exonuclease/phosphatase family metal-dependent hydrolase
MTYNVEGLPWPLAIRRREAMEAIGARLAELRAAGKAPQVVVLQEAFISEARMIGIRGGYRYRASGPFSDDPQPANDNGTALPRSLLLGEKSGPWFSSGLAILSDFPLSDVRSLPFPAGACAGYDCLANKGMLAVRLSVPDLAYPVEIVTTHLNCNRASGRPEPVNRIAYRQQLDAFGRWIAQTASPDTVRIYAGDFNVGHSPQRLAMLLAHLDRWNVTEVTAMGRPRYVRLCRGGREDCTGPNLIPANVPLRHAQDWQFYRAPAGARVTPLSRSVLFGRDRSGRMMSDHIGYAVAYRLG